MKNIVIAAGYATRLGELTKNFPKPLLKIGENTILGRMLDDIDGIPEIDEHVIITNHRFASIFEEWVGVTLGTGTAVTFPSDVTLGTGIAIILGPSSASVNPFPSLSGFPLPQ